MRWDKTVATPSVAEFSRNILGQTIREVDRRGKFIVIQLTTYSLLLHLRMSGDVFITEGSYIPAKHDRLLLPITGGKTLVFNDTRKFGRVWLVSDPAQVTGTLGPEPLDADFTLDRFRAILASSRRNIKTLLLDQKRISGMGNIYTDEALFLAGINPNKNTNDLTEAQISRLHQAMIQVLQEGIRQNGASFDWVYRGGSFQNHFNVYKRENLDCTVCGTKITKSRISQRGTHYCSNCQR